MASSQIAHQRLMVILVIVCMLRMIAPIFLGAAIVWTPSACYVAVQSFLLVLTGLQMLAGYSDGFFKNEPHTGKIPSPQNKRVFEIDVGSALLHWGAGMIAGLLAGGSQLMCRVNLAPMLLCTYYHYAAGAMSSVKTNCVIVILMVYFGFGQASTIQSVEWTSAACFLAFQASLMLIFCLILLVGPDGLYKSMPHLQEMTGGSSQGELFQACIHLAMGTNVLGAVMAGGAQYMCILQLPALLTFTYIHYTFGSKQDMAVNSIFIVILAYLGLVH